MMLAIFVSLGEVSTLDDGTVPMGLNSSLTIKIYKNSYDLPKVI